MIYFLHFLSFLGDFFELDSYLTLAELIRPFKELS